MSLLMATKKHLIPKSLLQVSTRETNNSMVSPPYEGGLKEARYPNNNIVISDSTLRNILQPQLKNMTSQYKCMCVCECCISSKSIHSSLLAWRDIFLKNLKLKVVIGKKEGLVKCPIVSLRHI